MVLQTKHEDQILIFVKSDFYCSPLKYPVQDKWSVESDDYRGVIILSQYLPVIQSQHSSDNNTLGEITLAGWPNRPTDSAGEAEDNWLGQEITRTRQAQIVKYTPVLVTYSSAE